MCVSLSLYVYHPLTYCYIFGPTSTDSDELCFKKRVGAILLLVPHLVNWDQKSEGVPVLASYFIIQYKKTKNYYGIVAQTCNMTDRHGVESWKTAMVWKQTVKNTCNISCFLWTDIQLYWKTAMVWKLTYYYNSFQNSNLLLHGVSDPQQHKAFSYCREQKQALYTL